LQSIDTRSILEERSEFVKVNIVHLCYLSLGANLGDAAATLKAAALLIEQLDGVRHIRLSSLYRTSPIGATVPQDDFTNAACEVKTTLGPFELFDRLCAIERSLGKEPKGRGEPRPIDIDLLLYGQLSLNETHLQLPHPRMLERLFVLLPLSELIDQIPLPSGPLPMVEHLERQSHLAGLVEQIT